MLPNVLHAHRPSFSPVLPFPLDNLCIPVLDLSAANPLLTDALLTDAAQFTAYVSDVIRKSGTSVAVGGYNEDRIIYRRSPHFGGDEPRSVHLGIDLWATAGTPVFAPLAGRVHSFRDNAGFGNYGPTLILQHELDGHVFYTLYGHLSRTSLVSYNEGQPVRRGERIATLGNYAENGDWPPHLHFQLVTDMMGMHGDFPGVAAPSQRDQYLSICPDANLILRIRALEQNA